MTLVDDFWVKNVLLKLTKYNKNNKMEKKIYDICYICCPGFFEYKLLKRSYRSDDNTIFKHLKEVFMKAAIIYFSNSGITEKLAKRIKKDTDGELIRVIPDKEYGGYFISIVKMIGEKITGKTRDFVNDIPDLSEYDTVFVGYPIWGGKAPVILQNFLKKCDLRGKRVIPFATAGASGIKSSVEGLKAVCSGAQVKYPFGTSKRNKGDYRSWMEKVKQ